MKYGIELVPNKDSIEIALYSKLAEKYGFDNVWITDHYNNRNAYICLTLSAMFTNRINLGIGVTNPYTYHPIYIIQLIQTISEISNGRVLLGIGPGDVTTLSELGIERKKPIKAIEEFVKIFRTAIKNGYVKFQGEVFNIKNARFNFKLNDVPIYIGAQGKKLLKLSGMIADGVLINFSNKKDIELSIKYVKEGMISSGRNNVEIVAYLCFSIDEDSKRARKLTIPVVAYILSSASKEILNRHNIEEDIVMKVRECIMGGNFKKLYELIDERILDIFSISGNPEECKEKIEELKELNLSQIVFGSPIGRNIPEALKLIKKII